MTHFAVFIAIGKLKFDSNTMGGIYRYGRPSFNIPCNFTYDIKAHDTIYVRWKINSKYISERYSNSSLSKSTNSGSSILTFANPRLIESGKIECEISYFAGSPKKVISATKAGFINIAGMFIMKLFRLHHKEAVAD